MGTNLNSLYMKNVILTMFLASCLWGQSQTLLNDNSIVQSMKITFSQVDEFLGEENTLAVDNVTLRGLKRHRGNKNEVLLFALSDERKSFISVHKIIIEEDQVVVEKYYGSFADFGRGVVIYPDFESGTIRYKLNNFEAMIYSQELVNRILNQFKQEQIQKKD